MRREREVKRMVECNDRMLFSSGGDLMHSAALKVGLLTGKKVAFCTEGTPDEIRAGRSEEKES